MISESSCLFTNAKIIGSDSLITDGWLYIEDAQINAFGSGLPNKIVDTKHVIDCGGDLLLPGFMDLHTHGCMGCDFNNATVEDIHKMTRYYAVHGVTSILASLYTDTPQQISHALQNIQSAMQDQSGSVILGVHLEGPWLNKKYCGAQDAGLIRPASKEEVLPYLNSGLIRLVALAPEIEGNQWLIRECCSRGITVSVAHSNATFEQVQQAVQMGVTQTTHTFNAMSPFHHRAPGVVGAALTFPELMCELIADNIHVHPAAMNLLIQNKTPDRVILISDSISAAGMPNGTYFLEGQKVICSNGEARLEDGTLAGSTLTLDQALINLQKAVNLPLEKIWKCSSHNAAKAIQVSSRKGAIQSKMDADLVLLDSNLQVRLTMAEGRIIYEKK